MIPLTNVFGISLFLGCGQGITLVDEVCDQWVVLIWVGDGWDGCVL